MGPEKDKATVFTGREKSKKYIYKMQILHTLKHNTTKIKICVYICITSYGMVVASVFI